MKQKIESLSNVVKELNIIQTKIESLPQYHLSI